MKSDIKNVCFVGAHCSHAVLTDKIGVYFCPFGACFKRKV